MKVAENIISNLSEASQLIFTKHQIRKSKDQKQAFRTELTGILQQNNWHTNVESGGSIIKSDNVVAGNLGTAQYIFTAHYDTPAVIPFPNFITPKNFVLYLLYQIIIAFVIIVPVFLCGLLIMFLTQNILLDLVLPYILCFALIYLLMFGPANKNNANDNTSGIIALLETALAVPPQLRDKCAFVFFDNEEKGLFGSAMFAKSHKELQDRVFVNFDCVGDGSNFLLIPSKKLKEDNAQRAKLQNAFVANETIACEYVQKGFVVFPSDHVKFEYSLGVGCFNKAPIIGHYLARIHTKKDTILRSENIFFLKESMLKLLNIA